MAQDDRIRWDRKYGLPDRVVGASSAFVGFALAQLPRAGLCLDVAGGAGRNALLLARHGLDVTICDVSPRGLQLAAERAASEGLMVRTVEWDVEADGLPLGPWDVIVCVHFLFRPLFAEWEGALSPGGVFVFEHPTRSNLERHEKPSARFLLDDGELPTLLEGLDALHKEEGWGADGRHEARLIARRP